MWLCSNENEFGWGEAAKPDATILFIINKRVVYQLNMGDWVDSLVGLSPCAPILAIYWYATTTTTWFSSPYLSSAWLSSTSPSRWQAGAVRLDWPSVAHGDDI
jgi:hypothetical protein